MLDVLLLLRPHIEAYCLAHEEELKDDILSFKEWGRLHIIRDFLYLFTRATLFIKGDSTSIDHTLFIMDVLIKHIQTKTISYTLPSLFLSPFLYFINYNMIGQI
jgi:hypothetical protein